ncbi:hypothetical protein HFP89_11440 [Wenzhouxiangella sp. XN79A]|uniref:hypothetical protein n=1 Tax=Wenzhouxiangella sp. XN79A TaxID=2724193 RepID=UPI00144AAF39|nr:hypothetical protein [Wenzhouxiangella sp. XN79A]NKI35775.1 hypothetical protein [Wenzhouxiangella sp. XN79A]
MTSATLARAVVLTGLLGLLLAPSATPAQATAFAYQGQLTDADGPVNGTCDFDFSLWSASSAGSQVGTDAAPGLAVSGGLFTAQLDFGAGAFDGSERWLEVVVDCGDGPATLPRQQLTASPYSLTSLSTVGLQGRPVSGAAPGAGEVLAWDGNQWAPAPDQDSGGDIEAVLPGVGLSGGGTSGTVGLDVEFNEVQRRVDDACPAGSSIRSIAFNGDVACELDSDTTYSGADFALSNQQCPAGQFVTEIDSDGNAVCGSTGGLSITIRTDTVTAQNLSGTQQLFATANCQAGEFLTGGGASASPRMRLYRSYPLSATRWTVSALKRSDDAAPGETLELTAYAMCASL